MKKLLVTLAFVSALTVPLAAASKELVKKWETPPELKTPESVLFDAKGGVLYVSNIDGKGPWARDGKGSIAKVGLDGKIIAAEWVTGLEAPKGLGLHNGFLYAADLDRVVVIDVAKAVITSTIKIEGAEGLNDITIDQAGVVYVSDSKLGNVHTIKDGKPSPYLTGVKGINGLLFSEGEFFLLADGAMYKVGTDKSLTKVVAGIVGTADGLERLQGTEFIATSWQGVIYAIDAAKGEIHTLLDTREQKVFAADIGLDAKHRMVYVPTFFANTVVAYEVK